MSADIKPGDLVMVVRPSVCCGQSDQIGRIGVVKPNPTWAVVATCDFCGTRFFDATKFCTIDGFGFHYERLKKIDPPALADDTETAHELETV